MSAEPRWEPVDAYTADLLDLVAHDQMVPSADREWVLYVQSIHLAADADRLVYPNVLRPLVTGHVAPRRVGAFTNRAKAEGLLIDTGEWQVSDDTEGRNAGRPMRVYRLGGAS